MFGPPPETLLDGRNLQGWKKLLASFAGKLVNTIRQQLRSDTSQTNRVRIGRNGYPDLSHNFIGLSMIAYKSKVVEVVNEQDLALIAKVQVSPFVRGGTTVVAAVVGQAPVQSTRLSGEYSCCS